MNEWEQLLRYSDGRSVDIIVNVYSKRRSILIRMSCREKRRKKETRSIWIRDVRSAIFKSNYGRYATAAVTTDVKRNVSVRYSFGGVYANLTERVVLLREVFAIFSSPPAVTHALSNRVVSSGETNPASLPPPLHILSTRLKPSRARTHTGRGASHYGTPCV